MAHRISSQKVWRTFRRHEVRPALSLQQPHADLCEVQGYFSQADEAKRRGHSAAPLWRRGKKKLKRNAPSGWRKPMRATRLRSPKRPFFGSPAASRNAKGKRSNNYFRRLSKLRKRPVKTSPV